jgi:soluble lytic murein transglycosylase
VQLPVSLQQWDRMDTLPASDTLKAFQRGMDLYFGERYAAALEALPVEQAAKGTAVGDYVLFYRGKANLMLERNKEALADFRALESRYPDSPMVREALLAQCQILLAMNDGKGTLAVLGNPKIGSSSESLYYQAKAQDLAGDRDLAAELHLRVYSRFPTSKYSAMSEQSLVSRSPGALKGTRNYDARLQRAESLISEGNSKAARLLLLALARVSAPNPESAEKRNLLFGEVEYRLGRSSAAIPYFHKVTAADPALHAKALYLEGVCARKLDKEETLLALRNKALKLYPRSSQTEELCYSAATHFDVNYEAAKARESYKVLYDVFPKGKYAERALWKMALFPYFQKNYFEAALGFLKYLVAYQNPSSAVQAMYWMGRCYDKLGDSESARYLFQRTRALANESYYGQRAREAETSLGRNAKAGRSAAPGIDFNDVVSICDGIQLVPLAMPEPDASGSRVILRTGQLIAAALTDLALTELRSGIRQYPQNESALCYLMARIYASKQDYDAAISSLRRAFPDYNSRTNAELPLEIWDVLFPVRYWGTINEQASRLNIDPALVLGVIRQESAFEPKARSRANARGLMQILPSTGRLLARQSKLTRYNAGKLYQAETNIILGTRYLASLLRQYGKPELALAAYNAGDSRVDRWMKEWGDLDMAEFVEQIPFSETRGYIRQVLNNRTRYGLLTSSGLPVTR